MRTMGRVWHAGARVRAAGLALVCAACGVGPGEPADASDRPALLLRDGFTTGSSPYTRGLRASGNATAVIQNGELIIRLNRFTDRVRNRTELVPNALPAPAFTSGAVATFGRSYWFSMRIRLSSDYIADTAGGESLMQWWATPDVNDPEAHRNPPLMLVLDKDRYAVAMRADTKEITPRSGPDRYTMERVIRLDRFEGDRGRWVCWVVNLRWDYAGAGLLKIWKDGRLVVDEPSTPLGYNDRRAPIFKFGIYKWGWNATSSPVREREMAVDDLAIGTGLLSPGNLGGDGCVSPALR